MSDANNKSPETDSQKLPSNQEKVKVILMGSKPAVTTGIHTLYSLRFAEVTEWSCLLPAPKPGEVMSIVKRKVFKQ